MLSAKIKKGVKNMKRIITAAMAALILVLTFAGCGAKSADLKTVMSDVNSKYSDATSGLKELTEVSDLDKYYAIAEADVKQFAAEINPDTSKAPVEIVLVEAVDKTAADNVKQALDARYQSIYSLYSSYSADQVELVKKCEVTQEGNFVTMVVADDYDGIMEVVNGAIK